MCKFLCGIESSERSPVVIGAKKDGFGGMLTEGGIYIYCSDIVGKLGIDISDGGEFGIGVLLHFFRAIELDGSRDDHSVDTHI